MAVPQRLLEMQLYTQNLQTISGWTHVKGHGSSEGKPHPPSYILTSPQEQFA